MLQERIELKMLPSPRFFPGVMDPSQSAVEEVGRRGVGPAASYPARRPISLWTCSIYHRNVLLAPESDSNVTLYLAALVLCWYGQPRLKQ